MKNMNSQGTRPHTLKVPIWYTVYDQDFVMMKSTVTWIREANMSVGVMITLGLWDKDSDKTILITREEDRGLIN